MENVKDYIIEQCEFVGELPLRVTYHDGDQVVLLELEDSLILSNREKQPQIITYLRPAAAGGHCVVAIPANGRGRLRIAHIQVKTLDEAIDAEEQMLEGFNPNSD